MRRLTGILCIILFIVYSCTKEQNKDSFEYKKRSLENNFGKEIEQARSIMRYLYLPVEMSDMFKNIDEDFDPSLLHDPGQTEKIIFSNEIALALGMYGVNLGYIRLFEQWNLANKYLQSINELSHRVGISNEIFNDLAKYFENSVYHKDTLEQYANEIYVLIDYYLRENERDNASALIILGGWLEAMKMGIEIYRNSENDIMLNELCKQSGPLNSIIALLALKSNNDMISNYVEQLIEIQNLMDGLNAAKNFLTQKQDETYSKDVVKNYLSKIEKIVKRMMKFDM